MAEITPKVEQEIIRDKYRGALLGLAVGDALGTTVEFRSPGTFSPVTNMIGGGPFSLKPGEWTDDTSMALCLAVSLIEKLGFDAKDQMDRYCRWRDQGYLSSNGRCFDIGNTVQKALSTYLRTSNPLSGSGSPTTAGNGSLMRLAPVPLFFCSNPEQAVHYAGESSRTTHGARTAVDACRYFAGLIVGAIRGRIKSELLGSHFFPGDKPDYWQNNPLDPKIAAITAGSFKTKEPPEIKGTGYVVESLEAALWAFDRSRSFREGALLAVNLGNDADTTAAIYGQLAGAFFGAEQIPPEWRTKLVMHDFIVETADQLVNLSHFFERGRWGSLVETAAEGQSLTAEDQLFILMQAAKYLMATLGLGAPGARICYERAEPFCQSLNQPRLQCLALRGQWRYSLMTDKLSVANQIAERGYSLAQEQNDAALKIGACADLAANLFFLGDFESARRYARHGVQIWRSGGVKFLLKTSIRRSSVVCAMGLYRSCISAKSRPGTRQWRKRLR